MTDRSQLEQTLKDAYAARMRGDLDAIAGFFAEGAEFRMVGAPQTSPIAVSVCGTDNCLAAIGQTIKAFDFVEITPLSMVVEGDKVAAHWRAKVRSTATGQEATTELVDIVEFKDGKIASFSQFCDTALAGRIMGPSPMPLSEAV
jgi:ketosteroid isomerase-like protein